MKYGIEDRSEERLAECKADHQRCAEQDIDNRGLELDEKLVVQDERETAEHQHNAGGDQWHDRKMSCHRIRNGKRDENRNHKDCSRNKDAELRVCCKK